MRDELRQLVDAARKVVKAHLELKKAHELEAADRVKKAKMRLLRDALDRLTDAMLAFEKAAAETKKLKDGKPFDWSWLARGGVGFVDMLIAAKRGSPNTVRKAETFIDAVWSDVKDDR